MFSQWSLFLFHVCQHDRLFQPAMKTVCLGFPLSSVSGCHLCSGFAFLLLLQDYTPHTSFFGFRLGLLLSLVLLFGATQQASLLFTSHILRELTLLWSLPPIPQRPTPLLLPINLTMVPCWHRCTLILLWSPVGTNVHLVQGSYHSTAIHCDWIVYFLSSEASTCAGVCYHSLMSNNPS